MKILILGAGRVGRSVAETLVSDANDITVVDESADRIAQLQERFDLRGVVGNASSPSVLSSAGAMDSDLLIAVTANDETNLVACTLAAQIFNIPMRIARVRDGELRHYPRILGEEGFRATSIIWPEQALATQFSKLIAFPAAQQVLNFADDKLTLFTVNSTQDAPLTGKTLEEAFRLLPQVKMRFISIYRRNRRLECRNDTVIEADDEITVLVSSDCAETVIEALHPFEKAETIVLLNGGELSGLLTHKLEPTRSKRRIKIFEGKDAVAADLSKRFSSSKVSVSLVKHDDTLALMQEGIDQADVVVALSNNDETNIMTALLAKRLGAKRSIVLLENQVYSDLVRGTEVDVTVSPTQASLGELLRHIRYGDVVNAQELYQDKAEALEIIAHGTKKSSKVVGKALRDIAFPKGVSVGAIVRGEGDEAEVLMAEPDLNVMDDDHLILFVPNKKVIQRIEHLFEVDVGFF